MKSADEIAEPTPERLSISLLLLWTAATSLVLGFDRVTSEPSNGELGRWPMILGLFYGPLVGAGVAAWALMFWRIWTEAKPFPSQPGHWLLLITGVLGIMNLFVRAMLATSAAGTASLQAFIAVRLIGSLVSIVIYFLAIREGQRLWQFFFALGMLSNVLLLLFTCFGTIRSETLMAWVLTGIMLLPVIDDLRTRKRRDYLHWLGVFARIAYLAFVTASPYLVRLLSNHSVRP